MKYTKDEALNEILKRGRKIRDKRNKKITGALSTATVISTFILFLSVSIFTGNTVTGTNSAYGSFLLPTEVLGYVIVAVIAFVGGVVINVCMKKSVKNSDSNDSNDDSWKMSLFEKCNKEITKLLKYGGWFNEKED